MKQDTLLQNAVDDLVLVLLDVATPEGKDLAETFNVRAFPTFAVLNADGETIYSWIGYGRSQSWTDRLAEALKDPITVAQRQVRYRSGPRFQDALILGKNSYREGRYGEAESYYRQARLLDPAAAAAADIPILMFRAVFSGVGAGQFSVAQAGSQVEKLLENEHIKPEHALEVAERLISVRGQVGREVIVPYLKMAHSIIAGIDDPELEGRRQWIFVEYALIVEQDPQKALGLKRQSLPEGWESDPDALNEFAWWCFENEINAGEAETLSRRSIELSQPGAEQANYLDTLAELVNLRGSTEEAAAIIREALQMNPESRYLKNQLARFEDIMMKKNQQEPSS